MVVNLINKFQTEGYIGPLKRFTEDQCKVICIISVMKGIEMCSSYLIEKGLLDQLKELVKYCVYKKYGKDGDGYGH